MPWWPMAMPSVTVMVQNSRGVPLAAATPFFTACAWRISEMLQGAALVPAGRHAHQRLVDLLLGETHGVKVRTVRGTRRPFRDVAARQVLLVEYASVHTLSIDPVLVVVARPAYRSARKASRPRLGRTAHLALENCSRLAGGLWLKSDPEPPEARPFPDADLL